MNRLFGIAFLTAAAAVCIYSQGVDIIVSVVDVRNSAIPNASARCSSSSSITFRSDVEGKIAIPGRACSDGGLTVSAPGFASAKLTLPLQNVSITLDPAAVAGEVTVSGTTTSLLDSASSVAVLRKADLDRSAAVSLDEKLRQVPGFTLFRRSGSTTANPTTQGVSLRGVGASGASRALVIVDGVPINDAFGGWIYWGRVASESISEVQVLRGPASDLYGSSAVGGVISITTRQAGQQPFASIDTSFGSQGTPFLSAFGGVGVKRLWASIATELFRTNGFIPVVKGSRGTVDSNANVGRGMISPKIEWIGSSSHRLSIAADYYREVRRNGTPLQNNDTLIKSIRSGYSRAAGKFGTLQLTANFTAERYNQSFSAIAADRRSENLNRLQRVPSQLFGVNSLWSAAWRKNVLYAGVDLRDIRGRSDETAFFGGAATSQISSGGRETAVGGYFGAAVRPLGKLQLSGGLRFDHWRQLSGYTANAPIGSQGTVTKYRDRSESVVSPRVSAVLRLAPFISLTATYASSFRQPTLNELYRSFRVGNAITLANPFLRAERAKDVQAAAIVSGLGDRIYARVGSFCTFVDQTISNVTLTVTPALITRERQNLGSTRTCGVEAELKARPVSRVSFGVSYLLADSRVTRQPANPLLEGLLLPQVPRHQFTFQARYDNPRVINVSVQLRASSRQFEDDQNLLPLKGFVTGDIFISRRLARSAEIYAAAENLTNSRIEAGRTPVFTLAQTRTFRVGVRLRFGAE